MNALQPEFRKVTVVSVGLSMVIFFVIQTTFKIPPALMFLKVGVVTFIVSMFWLVFDRWGWRWRFVRRLGYFHYPPDLNGRWEGSLQRVGEPEPHAFVCEILQTYSHIKVNAYSRNSRSRSISAVLFRDEIGSAHMLIYTWICTTKHSPSPGTTMDFHGTSIVGLATNEDSQSKHRRLQDSYFTNRNPQTRGTNELHWKGHKLYNSFDET